MTKFYVVGAVEGRHMLLTSHSFATLAGAHKYASTCADAYSATPVGEVTTPKIRFLVHTVTSAPDSNGNRYHWARITSTVTGRSLVMLDTTASNGRIMARRGCELLGLGGWCPEVHETDATIPKRQWSASVPKEGVYDHLVTAQMIADLETSEA